MNLPETHFVTARDTEPRLDDQPLGVCHFCAKNIGQEHTQDCLCRRKTIVVELRVKVIIDVDQSETAEQLKRDDLLETEILSPDFDEFRRVFKEPAHMRTDEERFEYWKLRGSGHYLRDATEEDHRNFGWASWAWESNTQKAARATELEKLAPPGRIAQIPSDGSSRKAKLLRARKVSRLTYADDRQSESDERTAGSQPAHCAWPDKPRVLPDAPSSSDPE